MREGDHGSRFGSGWVHYHHVVVAFCEGGGGGGREKRDEEDLELFDAATLLARIFLPLCSVVNPCGV